MKTNYKSKARAGFTLLEVMVSLTVGGIALGSIYAVGASATRHFRDQQRISAAQTSLRSAMATLKHDFQRAGFMSTPNSEQTGQACGKPVNLQNPWIGAIQSYKKNVTKPSKLDRDNLNASAKDKDGSDFFSVDEVLLTGNFATSGEYPNISVPADGMDVTVPMGWQSFQRDFTEWSGSTRGDCNEGVFQTAFPAGRLVRLHAQNGSFVFGTIAGATCTGTVAATVTLADPINPACNVDGGWIAPVSTMRYRVEDADANRGEDDPQQRTTVLRRTEVNPATHANVLEPMIGGVRVTSEDSALLAYVVRFKVNFLMLHNDNRQISYVPMTEEEWRDFPHRVRGAIIDVAVRTPQQDPTFTQSVETAAFKLYKTNGKDNGAARVRRMRAELLLPNVANRNLQ